MVNVGENTSGGLGEGTGVDEATSSEAQKPRGRDELAVAEGTGVAAAPGAVGGREELLVAEGTEEVSTPVARELREEGGSVLGTTRGGARAVCMRWRLGRLGR